MLISALPATETERETTKRSEFLLSAPALIQREPVIRAEEHSASPSEEVITVGEKIRDSVSFWKRIRSQGLADASDAAGRHTVPQHILYIK